MLQLATIPCPKPNGLRADPMLIHIKKCNTKWGTDGPSEDLSGLKVFSCSDLRFRNSGVQTLIVIAMDLLPNPYKPVTFRTNETFTLGEIRAWGLGLHGPR